jgi:hypothetical protein
MRTALAEKLLARIMNWDNSEISKQRPILEVLSNLKYDDYQQFEPGMRFIESLVRWLQQFELLEERKIAYEHFRQNLIYFSDAELSQLVNLAYPDIIDPIIISKIARDTNLKPYCVNKIINQIDYKISLRTTLFIALSDGAKIDQFRRSNNLSNEQVYSTYEITEEKADSLLIKLNADLKNISAQSNNDNKFSTLFLIDDFSASGITNFRNEGGNKKGKIRKILNAIIEESETTNYLGKTLDKNNLDIHIIFYVATEEAVNNHITGLDEWRSKVDFNFNYSVRVVQLLPDELKTNSASNQDFEKLIKKYFDNNILTPSYKKGKHNKPYLGFNECSLPVILNHNTPNNSYPIYWMEDNHKFRGLFPRIHRHKK